jgi:uncharacterized protein YukE
VSDGFHVVPDQLRDHATTVDELAGRAGTAADAGGQVASMHAAYGLLCQSIGKILAGPQQRCADSLGQVAQALRRITKDLDSCADVYERIDRAAATNFGRIGDHL